MSPEIRAQLDAVLDAPSNYPQIERKSRKQREKELLDWLDSYGVVNHLYNLYGADRVDAQPWNSWLDYGVFRKDRYRINATFYPPKNPLAYNLTLIARDKLMFEMFCAYRFGHGRYYNASFGVFVGREFFLQDEFGGKAPADFSGFVRECEDGRKMVFKQVFGTNGKDIVFAEVSGSKLIVDGEEREPAAVVASFASPGATWLAQDYIVQHDFMNMLNASSVNTLRVVTYHTGEHALIDEVAIRYGQPGSLVDNVNTFGEGGRFSSVDEQGRIRELAYSFTHKTCGPSPHAGRQVPFFDEIRKLVLDMHEFVPEMYTVGWDIAITPDGPICIEANDGWGPVLTQTEFGHGQRPAWERHLKEREDYIEKYHQH